MTQLLPNPRVAGRIARRTAGGAKVRLWQGLAVLALLVAPAFAQDAAPLPAPLPAFHAPLAGDDSQASDAGGDTPVASWRSRNIGTRGSVTESPTQIGLK